MLSILLRIYQAVFGNRSLLLDISRKLDDVVSVQQQILNLLTPGPAAVITFTAIRDDGTIVQGATMETLRDDQKELLTIAVTDKKGNPAALDGVPVWASSDETIAAVEPAEDGMSATVNAVRPGSCKVTVTGDADLGEGVAPLVGIIDISVTPGSAVQIEITGSAPVDQTGPEEPPAAPAPAAPAARRK